MRAEQAGLTEAQALERYRYLVRTAPPELLDLAHRAGFGQLDREAQATAVGQLNAVLPPVEQVPLQALSDPSVFSRAATRAELKQPGAVEEALFSRGAALPGTPFGAVVSSFIEAAAAQGLLGVFDEIDPVEAEAVHDADPGCDQGFYDHLEWGDLGPDEL
jgi:hypothetical protein